MGPIYCPETSVTNYHHSPRNNPEECGSHLLRDGSLKLGSVIRGLFPVRSRGRSSPDMYVDIVESIA